MTDPSRDPVPVESVPAGPSPPPPVRPARRRWFRLGLKTMLGLILVVSLGLGWWIDGAHRQHRAVAVLRAFNKAARISYDDGDLGELTIPEGSGPYLSWWHGPIRWLERRVPPDWLGRDYLHGIWRVGLGPPDPGTTISANDALAALVALRGVKDAHVGFPIDDADASRLATARGMKRLSFGHPCPGLTDKGLASLGQLGQLEDLDLPGAAITDAGLAHLGSLRHLRELTLGDGPGFPLGRGVGRVTGTGFVAFADRVEFRELNWTSHAISPAGIEQLGSLGHLQVLRLSGPVLASDLRHLAQLGDLLGLCIRWTDLDGSDLGQFARLPKLGMLELQHCRVGDSEIAPIAAIGTLEHIHFYDTDVTPAGMTLLKARFPTGCLSLAVPAPGQLCRSNLAGPAPVAALTTPPIDPAR